MGIAREPAPVKFVLAVLGVAPAIPAEIDTAIAQTFGEIELRSATERWSWSSYYRAEMGSELWRTFLALAELRRSDDLVVCKERSNELERRWSEGGRAVNVDPGYVDVDKLVLASTKAAAHRLHIGRGIHAECALRFENGRFEAWSTTYPDYRTPSALEFFTRVRRRLKQQRRAAAGAGRGVD